MDPPPHSFVVLHRAWDELEKTQVCEALRQDEIPHRVFGVDNPANLGITHLERPGWRIEVPANYFPLADRLLRELLDSPPLAEDELPWELRVDEQESP